MMMWAWQQWIIDLLRLRIKQLETEQQYSTIPKFLLLTAEQRRQAWIDYDSQQQKRKQNERQRHDAHNGAS
jgi:hypothetical protein